MSDSYENFDLKPIWHENSTISVECPALNLRSESIAFPGSTIVPQVAMPLLELANEGLEISKLLFTRDEIRHKFQSLWRSGRRIRLRLIYPHPQFNNNKDAQQKQIENLMGVPWEYSYLPMNDGLSMNDRVVEPVFDYFLGIRDDISIVHVLRDPQTNEECKHRHLEGLPAKVHYISWFGPGGGNQEITETIFKEFKQEINKIDPIVDYVGNKDEPDSLDAQLALENDHIVHITGHGNIDVIKIEDDDVLTLHELLMPFRLAQNPQVRMVIFLSCNSNSGDGGLAAALHRHANIPIVVGMAGTIQPVPTAENFVKGFYKGLALKPYNNLESAVVLGRRSILNQNALSISSLNNEDLDSTEWDAGFGLPRIFLGCPDSALIPDKLLFVTSNQVEDIFDDELTELLKRARTLDHTSPSQKALNAWVEENSTRWLIVSGKPGSGKSTHIARYVKDHGSGLIYHFCLQDRPETLDPLLFVRDSLVPQLIQHIGEELYYSLCPAGKFPLFAGSAKDALIDFVYIPLYRAQISGVNAPVIVIDGVDFIPPGHGIHNSVLGLLRDYHDMLDDVARFIITIDDTADDPDNIFASSVRNIVDQITHRAETLTIVPEKISTADLRKKFTILFEGTDIIVTYQKAKHEPAADFQPGTLPLFEQMLNRFGSIIEGDVPDEIKSPQLEADEWTSPIGLEKLFDYVLKIVRYPRNGLDWWSEKVRHFLDVVAASSAPLSSHDVAGIIDLDEGQHELLLTTLDPFFVDRNEDRGIRFFHHSIKKHILRDMLQHNRDTTTHQFFIEAFRPNSLEWYDENVDWIELTGTNWHSYIKSGRSTLNDNDLPMPTNSFVPTYARRYLVYHSYECYRGTQWSDQRIRSSRADDFLKLVCAPNFRNIRLAEVGRDAIVQDIRHALRVVYAEFLYKSKDDRFVQHIDHILAANEFDIQSLEQQLRSDQFFDHEQRLTELLRFLDLDQKLLED